MGSAAIFGKSLCSDPVLALPSVLAETIEKHAQKKAHEIARERAEFFLHWNARAADLRKEEEALRSKMNPEVERAVRGKKILLFEEMLKYYGYPDVEVVSELKDGWPLTGDVQQTSMLPFKFTPALLTCEALRVQSSLRRYRFLLKRKDQVIMKWTWKCGSRQWMKFRRAG